MSELSNLPVPVRDLPHWRVHIRPTTYVAERLASVRECWDLVEKNSVRLRGWPYPYVSQKTSQRQIGDSWVASWVDGGDHVEYWRFYQSAQFAHFFAIREAVSQAWKDQLSQTARGHLGHDFDWNQVHGFLSLNSFLYHVTEVFEFAARLAESGRLGSAMRVEIRLINATRFMLTPDWDRAWIEYYGPSVDDLGNVWDVDVAGLVASSAEMAINAVTWFFERFGWLTPNTDVLRKDQQKFLDGRV